MGVGWAWYKAYLPVENSCAHESDAVIEVSLHLQHMGHRVSGPAI